MISKNLLLGVSLLLGTGVIWYATSQQSSDPQTQTQTNVANQTTPIATTNTTNEAVAHPVVEPLTVSKEEEDKLLADKQKEREMQELAQGKQSQEFLAQQEQAHQSAIDKSIIEDNEQKAIAQQRSGTEQRPALYQATADLTVETRPESIAAAEAEKKKAEQARAEKAKADRERAEKQKAEQAKADKVKADKERAEKQKAEQARLDKQKADKAKAEKQKAEQAKADKERAEKQKAEQAKQAKAEKANTSKNGQHTVVRGDTLIKLSRQYGVPVSALAEANNMSRDDALPTGKSIKIPSKAQVARLEREAQERETKRVASANAEKRLNDARQKDSSNNSKARYGVQVSMADSQAQADELAKKYRSAGYKVTTSPTTRGVRVLVGSEKSQEAAEALRDKIRNDGRVDGSGAWVKRIQ